MSDCCATNDAGTDRCVLPSTMSHAHHLGESGQAWPNVDYVSAQSPGTNPVSKMTVKEFRQFTKGVRRGDAERDEALARVESGADPEWLAKAERVIRTLAYSGVPFIADDIWEWMPVDAGSVDPRAVGPVMMRLAREGTIVKTGQIKSSQRRHSSPMTEWVGSAALSKNP